MDLQKLQHLAAAGESNTLEYKTSTARLKAACETLCGFLNTEGGNVLIGVQDSGKVVGQQVTDKTRRELGNELAKIAPHVDVKVQYIPIAQSDKSVIVCSVEKAQNRPCFYDGRAYIRSQSDTLPMPIEHQRQLMINRVQDALSWEDHPLPQAQLEELDSKLILKTIRNGIVKGKIPENYATEDTTEALTRLGLLNQGILTRAAYLLYAKDPSRLFPQCLLRMARFRGKTKRDFIDNKQVRGNVFELIQAAMKFANMYLPVASHFPKDSYERVDTPLFPIMALREAITNAMCHRDYTDPGGSVALAIFDDRVEIWSYGILPYGLRVDELRDLHQSKPRNHRIAEVLYYHNYLESWGRGIQLIFDECQKAGHPLPKYEINTGGVNLIMYANEHAQVSTACVVQDGAELILTERQQEVLSILEQGSYSTKEIHAKMINPPSDRWLRNELNKLKQGGYLLTQGHTSTKKWALRNSSELFGTH